MDALRRTPLYDRHLALEARMVPFAGWEMPVQYEGVIPEHKAVRLDCGVFDVSHMGQLEVEGAGAHVALEHLLSNDLDKVAAGDAQYTLLTDDEGGIVEDLIAYRRGPSSYLLIVNAANRENDVNWLRERLPSDVTLRDVSDAHALIAVQGPRAIERLGLPIARSFTFTDGDVLGVRCTCTRTGYTGEKGVELLCRAEDAAKLWDAIVAAGAKPCGLGARDTLRLEACLPLHGQDISRRYDPISAGLSWVCALEKEFTGVEPLRRIATEGPRSKLVAFVMTDPGVPRAGMAIVPDGTVTSGTHSPMLERGIGMGYVPAALSERGNELTIDLRGRERRAQVVEKPIYKKEGR